MDNPKLSFADVQAAYDKALLLADRDIVRLIAAVVLANQLQGPPVWMLIVASSSGGKSELLMTLDEFEFVKGKQAAFFISDLTENTLASGFKSSTGEVSLLKRIPYGGLMIFKDFTSLLTKRKEGRDAIMGQLREVYDRKFDKMTGNNADVQWKGKIGALAGVTQAVHEYIADMAVMGDRFVMYSFKQPNRRKVTDFVLNKGTQEKERDIAEAKQVMHRYLQASIKGMAASRALMSDQHKEKLIEVADFVTQVRSGVVQDERFGHVKFVPSVEMPLRLIEQLMSIGAALSHMHKLDGEEEQLTDADMNLLFTIAFDSIPLKRRWALRALAKYMQGITTSGLAVLLNYETDVVKSWLAQLNALGIAHRTKSSGSGDMWTMNEEFREMMEIFDGVERKDEFLGSKVVDESLMDDAYRNMGGYSDEEFEDPFAGTVPESQP